MSVSSEITRLQGAKADIKAAIENKGVNVPSSEKIDNYDTYINQIQGNLQEKTVTPNAIGQTVLPDANYDGLSQVVVNGDINLIPSNVLKDVTIFGTTGIVEPYVAPNLQSKSATPSAIGQTVVADTGYDGLSSVDIDGDFNLVAGNIRKDVSIFGVTGTLDPQSAPVLQSKSVTPSASSQTVTPDIGYDGLSSVSVSGDSNLISNNIKKNVSIFGVTGNYEGSGGGSSEFNIYVQNSEPTSKNGVWIKKASASQNAYFTSHFTKQGYFIDDNFSYMNQTTPIYAQCIAGNYLYVFGNSSSESFKYNLRTGEKVGTINVPTFGSTFQGMAVYCAKNNSIYVGRTLTGNNQYFRWFKYDIDTNTSMLYDTQFAISRTDSIRSATIYGDYVYFYVKNYIYSNSKFISNLYKINVDDGTTINEGDVNNLGLVNCESTFAQGKYIYTRYGTYAYKHDITTNTYQQKTILTSEEVSEYSGNGMIVVSGNKLYSFFSSSSKTFDTYLIYDWGTDEKTFKNSNIPYFNIGTSNNSNILDEADGVVYFHRANYDTLAFQLSEYNLEDYTSNSPLIVQDLVGQHMTIIDDSSQLTIGVKDAFIIDSNKQLEDYMTCYGDGNKWIVIKNPTGETCTLSYDLDGGTGTFPSQTVVCGTVPIAPSNVPTKSGAIFESWYLGNEPFDFSTPIAVDTTLTAHYLAYEEVEYIQSTGTQYIDTGIVPKSTTKMVVDFAYTQSSTSSQINGWGSNNSNEAFSFGVVGSSQTFYCYVTSNYTATFTNVPFDTNKHTFSLESGSQKLDNVEYGTNTIGDTAEAGQTMYLFAIHGEWQSSGGASYSNEKIYSCKIYDGNTLVRDFQPILDSNNTPCLHDKITGTLFYNLGSGTFEYGELT